MRHLVHLRFFGTHLLRQPGPGESAIGLRFIDAGKTLVSIGRDDTVRWWDWRTGKQERSVPWHTMMPRRVAFSPVGDLIALGTPQGTVRLLSAKSGLEVGRVDGGKDSTVAVAFSPDGTTPVVGGDVGRERRP